MKRPMMLSDAERLALLGAALLWGCTGSSGNVALGLKLTSANQALITADTDAGIEVAQTVSLPAGLSVDRARLLLNEVELHAQQRQIAGRVVRGAYVLTLTGDDLAVGATKTVADVTAPAGTYADLELEFEPLDTSEQVEPTPSAATAADLADFTAANASAIVEGTYNGTTYKIVGAKEI